MASGAGSAPGGLAPAGIVRSQTDPEQLSQWRGVRARIVDLHGPGASDALLDDQAAVCEPIDLAHHGGWVHVERAGEIGQSASLVVVEEQLDQEAPLRIASKERGSALVLHETQYILQNTQDKFRPASGRRSRLSAANALDSPMPM